MPPSTNFPHNYMRIRRVPALARSPCCPRRPSASSPASRSTPSPRGTSSCTRSGSASRCKTRETLSSEKKKKKKKNSSGGLDHFLFFWTMKHYILFLSCPDSYTRATPTSARCPPSGCCPPWTHSGPCTRGTCRESTSTSPRLVNVAYHYRYVPACPPNLFFSPLHQTFFFVCET